jgi:CubicO group peptidase (beta-lactamase class C family)
MIIGSFSVTDISRIEAAPARLGAAIDRALAEKRIVGTVVEVAHRGTVIFHRAAGFADRETQRPLQENGIFRLASLTKPVVTVITMQLVEQGRIRLDAPVTDYLHDFRPRLADGSEPRILLHHLLTHTSGLRYKFAEVGDGPYHRLNVSDGLDQPGLGIEENLRRLAAVPLLFAPGTGWGYSLGLDVMGAVIEKVSGQSLPDVLRERITGPLGLTDTAFNVVDVSRLVKAYADGKPEPVVMTDGMDVPVFDSTCRFAPSRILDPGSYPSGGAGLAGTAKEFMRFLEVIRTGGAPVLKSQTVAEMLKDQVGAQAQTRGPGWGFGYGWAVLSDAAGSGSPQSQGTIQWGGAYGHSWFIDPASELSVVALTNTAFEGMVGAFPVEIRDAVYGV